jgi:hypothetical protein
MMAALFLVMHSCGNNTASNSAVTSPKTGSKRLIKPPSTFQDTLTVNVPAAVFFSPDSVQLIKLKALLDSNVYKSLTHTYFYQLRYAHITTIKEWPAIRIFDCYHYRYLLFIKNDGSRQCIDLDTKGEDYGMYVFDGKKNPLPVDMTNIETQVSFYLR